MISISMGHKCNNNCIMCVKIRENEQKKTDPSKEDIFNFIDNLPEDEREIVLTDGEPTMRNTFREGSNYPVMEAGSRRTQRAGSNITDPTTIQIPEGADASHTVY